MKGVIMAGGEGTRLRPLTSEIPKPMVPIMNKPVMEYIVRLFRKHHISDIAVTMCYRPNVITDYFGAGDTFGVNLNYFIEDTPLGTGGSVLNAKNFLDDTFVVISGDAFTDINIDEALKFHRNKKSKATLVLKREAIPLEYGIVITDEEGKIVKFLEKPGWGEVFSDTINTGIYILEPEIFNYYKKGDNFDFSKDLFPKLLKDNIPMYGYVTDAYWNDIGDLGSYRQTHIDILDKKVRVELDGTEYDSGIFIGENTSIPQNVRITSPVYIGNNCTIKPGISLDSYTVIGDNCEINENSNIIRSILWSRAKIGRNVDCTSTIICNRVYCGNNINIFQDSVIGSNCIVESGSTIKSTVKIWPGKNIKENTTVSRNLIWESFKSHHIFGNRGITGEININITPEFATLLGSAFGTLCNKNRTIICSSDESNASLLIKECISSGLMASGSRVISLDKALVPISRFAVRFYKASGGIHVRQDALNSNMLHIEIFGENGGNIDRNMEKKLENLFALQDFERASVSSIGDIIRTENFSSFYIQSSVLRIDNIEDIRKANPKVLITSISAEEAALTSTYLKQLGCDTEILYPGYRSNNIDHYIEFSSEKIKEGNYSLGIVLTGDGENTILIDECGNAIYQDKFTLLTYLISLESGVCRKIIVPNTTSSRVEELVQKYDCEVIRTKSSVTDSINKLLSSPQLDDEQLIQYELSFNSITAVGRIISFLVKKDTTLNTVIADLPSTFMTKTEIPCEFKERGRVIGELIRRNNNENIELFEGIKIKTDNGWTLVLPDHERPVFKVFSEGYSSEYAEELSGEITERVKEIISFSDYE